MQCLYQFYWPPVNHEHGNATVLWKLKPRTSEKWGTSAVTFISTGKAKMLGNFDSNQNTLDITSSKISLFLCRRSGSSWIILSNSLIPPLSLTDDALSTSDCGSELPDVSSKAAGRFKDAKTLKTKSEYLCYTITSLCASAVTIKSPGYDKAWFVISQPCQG